MNVLLFMAQTPNGIIARDNYSEDFLSHENWKTFVKLAEEKKCFIIGRTTYQQVKKWPTYDFDHVNAQKIVVSKNRKLKLGKRYTLAKDPKDALQKVVALGFNHVLLTGGGTLNSAFMKEGLVDELILNLEPHLIGKGIRTFTEENFETKLKLIGAKKTSKGIIQLHYSVEKRAKRQKDNKV